MRTPQQRSAWRALERGSLPAGPQRWLQRSAWRALERGSLPRCASEVTAALLFAVVVELALPVHHVGGPAVELHLPLPLRLVNVVWRRDRDNQRHQPAFTNQRH